MLVTDFDDKSYHQYQIVRINVFDRHQHSTDVTNISVTNINIRILLTHVIFNSTNLCERVLICVG